MRQSYTLEVKPERKEERIKLYTTPIPPSERETLFERLRTYCNSEYLFDSETRISGLRSISIDAFFSRYPVSDKLRETFIPSSAEFAEAYDAERVAALEQALYIHLIGDSLAMPTHLFKVVGEEAINGVLEDKNGSPEDLSSLVNTAYLVLTDYSYQSSRNAIIVSLRTK